MFFQALHGAAQVNDAVLLAKLDSILDKREKLVAEKSGHIQHLKLNLSGKDPDAAYDQTLLIFNEYKSFNYDSAFRYARKLQDLSRRRGDIVRSMQAKINLGFALVSAGLFNETLDSLRSIRSSLLPDTLKPDYYYLMGRTCFDLAEFNGEDFYSVRYIDQGRQYLDSALMFLNDRDIRYFVVRGLRALHRADMASARESYEKMMALSTLTDAELAIATSTLSFIYTYGGNPGKAKEMLIRAAIADTRASTKETVALRNLAELLFNEGDVEKAYKYIKIALEDANFYGANHRKIQVAAIYPVIEGKYLALVQAREDRLVVYSIGITLFSVMLIGFGVVVYRQFQKLQRAKQAITKANADLTDANHQLLESNKIKEEYVTYYFNTTADYISKLENLKKSMEMKLLTKKMDDLRFVVESINIRRERDELYHNFDKVFLKLFPDFVTVFQSLFKEEDRVHLKEGQLLNTELRIFALMRMGITDNEKISKILDYSVTTIYTYKTRLRNKSIVPNEEFDKRIMSIRTI
jgi:tetratricopeptide (TPR) repeat protein